MAKVTSGKIARCDWLLTWRDFSVMTAGIVNKNKHPKKQFFLISLP